VLATGDRELARRVSPALRHRGFDVVVTATNLEIVFQLTNAQQIARNAGLVIDTRRSAFGTAPLDWLRTDPVCCPIVVLAQENDIAAIEAAELSEAAAVVAIPTGRTRTGALVREVERVLRGRRERDLLRWTPPRAAPWIRPKQRSGRTLAAA
jgi:hypothetical protein